MFKKNKKTEEGEKISLKEKIAVHKGKFRKLFTKRNIIIGVIALFFLIQFIQLQSLFGSFSFLQGRDTSLITEIGQIKDSYTKIGTDLNEVREFLRLPTESYAVIDTNVEEEKDDEKNENQVQIALFQYMDYLAKEKTIQENVALYKGFLDSLKNTQEFGDFLIQQNLTLSGAVENDEGVTLTIDTADENKLISYYLSKEEGVLYKKTVEEKNPADEKVAEEFQKNLVTFITNNKQSLTEKMGKIREIKAVLDQTVSAQETIDAEAKLGTTISEAKEVGTTIVYSINNKSAELIGEIVLDAAKLEISLLDKNDPTINVIVETITPVNLISFLEKLDSKTFIEEKVEQAKVDIENTMKDEGFLSILKQYGLTMRQPREDDLRIYYDIYLGETHMSSIVLEKTTGVVNIVHPDGTQSENLLFFDPDFKKKTLEIPENLPDYGDEITHEDNTFNILIAGKHGSLVDTMIFAHVDEDQRTVRMISIPRDLWYNGRKINALAVYYGMPELKRVLGDITGYELDKYILIDMYAFIDVIDIIGGIDIHLDSAVIDPTYRTVDNGVVGTLYYEPGDYHLGGKEALRLARTRHTSSDFARASRQQMILEALQDKAKNFGFGDAATIYEIIKTVLGQTESDISIDEAVAYYFRYQNFEIMSNAVMSSGNVLYVPPYITTENCDRLEEEAAAAAQPDPGCANDNHAYTLLPRGDNWNIVKWFFKQEFEGVEA